MEVARHPEIAAEIGIVGGSGLYALLEDAREVQVETPYGPPSAPLTVAAVEGRSVAFLPRHGHGHTIPPHRINYRANIWALKHLGVTDVVLPCAVGSLQPGIRPGTFVLADQVVDRTKGRIDTFYDGPETTHVGFADPYDAEMRQVASHKAAELGIEVHERGTLVVIQGPRFSTRAESRWFSGQGWHVVGMTQYPEVVLCRELEMAALNISLVTDFDAGLEDDPAVGAVSTTAVLEVFQANLDNLRRLLFAVVPALPLSPDRPALHALDDARL